MTNLRIILCILSVGLLQAATSNPLRSFFDELTISRGTEEAFVTRGCSCYVLKWCRVAQIAIPQGGNFNFAKQNQHERQGAHPRR